LTTRTALSVPRTWKGLILKKDINKHKKSKQNINV
jgi:hypothetical protein